jgi:hypothetical protein
MTPANVTPCPTAVMAVVLNGQEHRITVEPGRTGRRQFEREIRRLFSLSQEDELEFTFDCQTPGEGVCPCCHPGVSLHLNCSIEVACPSTTGSLSIICGY